MPGREPDSCSARSLAADEPLLGTASRYRFWLLVEQPGPWGHHALIDSGFPRAIGAELRRLGGLLGIRVLLIKRRDRPWPAARRCYVAYTGVGERRIGSLEIGDPAELLELDLRSLMGTRFAGVGDPVAGPLYLVCTHGKHDACCARRGGPLYRSLAGFRGGPVWEATHVGGDRFAGNLVCFPHGLYFGRVPPSESGSVAAAYAAGRVDLRYYRGRSAYPPPVQAAESFLRSELGVDGVDDLELTEHLPFGDDLHRVRFHGPPGRAYTVEVEVFAERPRLVTCKATTPHRPRAFTLRALG